MQQSKETIDTIEGSGDSVIYITKKEAEAIYKVLEREWISPENELAHQVIKRIETFIHETK